MEEIQNIKNEAIAQITQSESEKELEEIRASYLGKNGKLTKLMKEISNIPKEDKKQYGLLLNDAKMAIVETLGQKLSEINTKPVSNEWYDITKPGSKPNIGYLHAQTKVLSEICDIFRYLGYQIADGPDIETDYYNFEALNIGKDHPARDTQQTFYIDKKNTGNKFGEYILRTQTSAMQGRIMEKTKPPIKVIVPGTCYRYEQIDASHGFQFQQVEGFLVDREVHLTDLFGTIDYVLKQLFGNGVKIRFAVTNFPFVEPGVDTYISCTICNGSGCSFCKNTGWSEIMPSGMIHPAVLKKSGIDPSAYRGFAFAIGLSRIINLKYQISDLRILTTPDLRILRQF